MSIDIDECVGGLHSCSPDAYCHNTKGSYSCTCRPGFTGSGRECEEADFLIHCCSYSCWCFYIYIYFFFFFNDCLFLVICVFFCSDINECARGLYKCSPDAFCNNTKGSYNCLCKHGFTGNGRECKGRRWIS